MVQRTLVSLLCKILHVAWLLCLQVFDGTKRFVEQPQLFNGVWHRPTYSSTGHNILLQFNPDLKRVINYSGFRFSAWRTLGMLFNIFMVMVDYQEKFFLGWQTSNSGSTGKFIPRPLHKFIA